MGFAAGSLVGKERRWALPFPLPQKHNHLPSKQHLASYPLCMIIRRLYDSLVWLQLEGNFASSLSILIPILKSYQALLFNSTHCIHWSSLGTFNLALPKPSATDSSSEIMVNFSPVALLNSPNKGQVLTARHALSTGALLVKERPYFTIHNPDNHAGFLDTTDQMEVKISQEVERKLSKQQADTFRSLLNNFPKYPLSGILKTNGLRCGWSLAEDNFSIEDITVDDLPKYGVYPTISYASHSCSPNAHYSWDPDTGMGRVYVISAILPGQNITIMRTSWGSLILKTN